MTAKPKTLKQILGESRTVFDPSSKQNVPVKSIKAKAGGTVSKHDVPSLANWSMSSGGTFEHHGRNGYSHRNHENSVEYHITPNSTKSGRKNGYSVKSFGGGASWRDLGIVSHPNEGVAKARAHYDKHVKGSVSEAIEDVTEAMEPIKAANILNACGVKKGSDYHTLSHSQVDALVDHAKKNKYRKPKNANGSTGRYFHAHLQRSASKINEEKTDVKEEKLDEMAMFRPDFHGHNKMGEGYGDDGKKYKVRRMYKGSKSSVTIAKDLTLGQARSHCEHPETSSSTCTKPAGKRHTRLHGDWFDGYSRQ